jgi:hypothetical protein
MTKEPCSAKVNYQSERIRKGYVLSVSNSWACYYFLSAVPPWMQFAAAQRRGGDRDNLVVYKLTGGQPTIAGT